MCVGVFVWFEDGDDFSYFPVGWYDIGIDDPIVKFGDNGYGVI